MLEFEQSLEGRPLTQVPHRAVGLLQLSHRVYTRQDLSAQREREREGGREGGERGKIVRKRGKEREQARRGIE